MAISVSHYTTTLADHGAFRPRPHANKTKLIFNNIFRYRDNLIKFFIENTALFQKKKNSSAIRTKKKERTKLSLSSSNFSCETKIKKLSQFWNNNKKKRASRQKAYVAGTLDPVNGRTIIRICPLARIYCLLNDKIGRFDWLVWLFGLSGVYVANII